MRKVRVLLADEEEKGAQRRILVARTRQPVAVQQERTDDAAQSKAGVTEPEEGRRSPAVRYFQAAGIVAAAWGPALRKMVAGAVVQLVAPLEAPRSCTSTAAVAAGTSSRTPNRTAIRSAPTRRRPWRPAQLARGRS
jgi:hypothetical protein